MSDAKVPIFQQKARPADPLEACREELAEMTAGCDLARDWYAHSAHEADNLRAALTLCVKALRGVEGRLDIMACAACGSHYFEGDDHSEWCEIGLALTHPAIVKAGL